MKNKHFLYCIFSCLFFLSYKTQAQEIKTREEAILFFEEISNSKNFYINENYKRLDGVEETLVYELFGNTLENEYLIFGVRRKKYENGEIKYGNLQNFLINLTDSIVLEEVQDKNSKKTIYLIKYKNYTIINTNSSPNLKERNKKVEKFYQAFIKLKSTFDTIEKAESKVIAFTKGKTDKTDIVITEEQRKYIVQANAANEKKDYANAMLLYRKAIEVNLYSYPDAYFNMALIFANLEHYYQAAYIMRAYLILKPDAEDARKAQDKIYEWELNIKY